MSEDIKRTVNNDRGLGDYGDPVTCRYGSIVSVRDSSSADDACCWLRIDGSSWLDHRSNPYDVSAHLNIEGAKDVIARLQAFVDERGDE